MVEEHFDKKTIRRKAWELELRDILDKYIWLTNEEARLLEQKTIDDKGTITRAQFLNRQFEQLSENKIMVRNNPDEMFYKQVFEAKRKEVREMAKSTTPTYLAANISRNMAENLERAANIYGISFFTGNGLVDWENE